MNGTLLWVDDEIELLKAYVIFLEKKEYEVVTATNGQDALDLCRERSFDLIFLDENMPGLSGLETLSRIKEINSTIPVVMVTKSEEENIMNQAIGSKIADYFHYPVRAILSVSILVMVVVVLEILRRKAPKLCSLIVVVMEWLGGITLELYLLHQSYMILFEDPYKFTEYIFVAVIFPLITSGMIWLVRNKLKRGKTV